MFALSYNATLSAVGFMAGIRTMQAGLLGMKASMLGVNNSINSMGGVVSSVFGKISSIIATVAKVAAGLTLAFAGLATYGIYKSLQAAMEWEQLMAGVAKTTGLAGEELKEISNDILGLSTTMPTSRQELAKTAQVAGQLGIAKKDIKDFTELMSMMSVSFEMDASAIATAMAKQKAIWGFTVGEMKNVGSAMNYLGNTTAASEREMTAFLLNIGKAPKNIGMSIQETMALGNVMIATGMDASDAGTRINSMFGKRGLAGHLDKASDLMGMTQDQFRKTFANDQIGTIAIMADKIGQIEDPLVRANAAAGIFGAIGGKVMENLIGNTDLLLRTVDATNEAYAKGTSLQEEYGAMAGTNQAKWDMIKNTVGAIMVKFGELINESPKFRAVLETVHNKLLDIYDRLPAIF